MVSSSFASEVASACGSASGVAFGRSQSGALWVLTGVSPARLSPLCRVLAAAGLAPSRAGCSLSSGRCWVAFGCSSAGVVSSLAAVFPLAPGSRRHRLLSVVG